PPTQTASDPQQRDNARLAVMPASCPPVDLVFVMDTSGSMFDEAAALCSNMTQVVADLAADGIIVNPAFLGIVETPVGNFPCLQDSVLSFLGSAVPGDGSCGPLAHFESWGPATAIVAERFNWSPGSIRVIVPLSDEGPCRGLPCNDPGDDRDSVENAVAVAAANNIVVSTITGTGASQCAIDLATRLALGTNGVTFQSTDPMIDLAGFILTIVEAACALDCNTNGTLDEDDLGLGQSEDCNTNDTPDECDISGGGSLDCNSNGTPDECDVRDHPEDDCNTNGVPDVCDIFSGDSLDCNSNGTPDECDVRDHPEDDCNTNGVPDECDILFPTFDCDVNGSVDACELRDGLRPDCNTNNTLDLCDVLFGISDDCNTDRRPDECELDTDGDSLIDVCDGCPTDPLKVDPGTCGCGVLETDSDLDGSPDCIDGCPNDARKREPGMCGCGALETDSDQDGLPNCLDDCPTDPLKTEAGLCGCGQSDRDTDADGAPDCEDRCPEDARLTRPALCLCSLSHDECAILLGCQGDLLVFADESGGKRVFFDQPRAFDRSIPTAVFASHQSGDLFPVGDTIVSFTIRDLDAGDQVDCGFTLTVRPAPAPSPGVAVPLPTGGCGLFGPAAMLASWALLATGMRRRRRRP
ncbi:MAG: HYR domain-containing protein, partial [Phycisphaerae bacterium]